MLGNSIPDSGIFLLRSIALTRSYRSPMGMAAIGIALYNYVMKYSRRIATTSIGIALFFRTVSPPDFFQLSHL